MYRSPHYSEPITVRIHGREACFTRAEHRTERLSNLVASHAGWEGCLSALMGHKGAHYQIESAALLFVPRWKSVTSNEVSDFGSGSAPINTDRVRTLRTTTLLCGSPEVDYLLTFRLLAATSSDLQKYRRMLIEDRLDLRIEKNGALREKILPNGKSKPAEVRYFRQPCLGLRELTAEIEPVLDASSLQPVDLTMGLGICYYGCDWDDPRHPHYFADLNIQSGICRYPSWDDVRRTGIRRERTAPSC